MLGLVEALPVRRDATKPIFFWLQSTPVGRELFLCLYTKKCNWSHCTFCSLPSVSSPVRIEDKHVIAQSQFVFDSLDKKQLNEVKRFFVSNNGSVLDRDTMPLDVLDKLCEMAHTNCPSLEIICFETRYETIVKPALEHFLYNFLKWHDSFKSTGRRTEDTPVKIQLSCGYETHDQHLRNNILKKGYPEEMVLECFEICSEINKKAGYPVILFDANVLLKPAAELTDDEAIHEAYLTIVHLNKLSGIYQVPLSIRLNPAFVAKNTILQMKYNENKYKPPSLGDVIKVIQKCYEKHVDVPVFVGLNDEELSVAGGSFIGCSVSDKLHYEAINEFNSTQDYKTLLESNMVLS